MLIKCYGVNSYVENTIYTYPTVLYIASVLSMKVRRHLISFFRVAAASAAVAFIGTNNENERFNVFRTIYAKK